MSMHRYYWGVNMSLSVCATLYTSWNTMQVL